MGRKQLFFAAALVLCVAALLATRAPDAPQPATGRTDTSQPAASAVAIVAPAVEDLAEPPFTSTADTVFDIIRADDPSTFDCLAYEGRTDRQIWDKRVDGEPIVSTFVFVSQYNDGTTVRIALNPEFGSVENAREEALRYTKPLGQLPTSLRRGIRWLSIHKGDEGFHAGDEQIIMYAGKTDDRLGYDHLEESVFHEAVHASWDARHRLAPEWRQAQEADGRFLTRYGQRSPEREDLAETALFAYGLLHYPGRIPPADTTDTQTAVPNRIAYVETLLPPGEPIHFSVGQPVACAAHDR